MQTAYYQAVKANKVSEMEIPAAFSTTIRPLLPPNSAGTVKVRVVSENTTKLTNTPLIFTEVVPVNPDPVRVTVLPTDCDVGAPEVIIAGASI